MLMATSIGYNFVALVATLGDQYLQPMGELHYGGQNLYLQMAGGAI